MYFERSPKNEFFISDCSLRVGDAVTWTRKMIATQVWCCRAVKCTWNFPTLIIAAEFYFQISRQWLCNKFLLSFGHCLYFIVSYEFLMSFLWIYLFRFELFPKISLMHISPSQQIFFNSFELIWIFLDFLIPNVHNVFVIVCLSRISDDESLLIIIWLTILE